MTTRGERRARRDKRRIDVATARLASFLPRSLWLLDELTATLRWLRERELWVIMLISLVLWTVAYQWHYEHRLDFGGDPVSHLREYDAPYLQGSFNESEPAP